MLKMDGLDDAIVGMTDIWVPSGTGATYVEKLVYDGEKIIASFMAQGMSEEEAYEFCSFNIEGAYMGPETPIIFWPYNKEL